MHECDVRRTSQVRFKLLDVSAKEPQAGRAAAAAGAAKVPPPQSTWSDWIGLEQLQQRPVFDCIMQIESSSPAVAPLPLHTQIRRSASVASGAVSLSFLVPFWLNNQSGLPLRFSQCDSLYENERFLLFKWRPPSLPTDRENFSNENGSRKSLAPHQMAEKLPQNCEWEWAEGAGWAVEMTRGKTDEKGWQYGINFPHLSHSPAEHNEPLHSVRRRKWFRHRMLKPMHVVGGAAAAVGLPLLAKAGRQCEETIPHVRMFGAPSSQPIPRACRFPSQAILPPPAAPIDLAHAATDSSCFLPLPIVPPESPYLAWSSQCTWTQARAPSNPSKSSRSTRDSSCITVFPAL